MNKKVYNKLVRDNIPKIIQMADKIPITSTLTDKEYKTMLDRKLIEEVNEYIESKEIEELADVLEVIYAICDLNGFSKEQLEKIRKDKADRRGGFRDKILLKGVCSDIDEYICK